MKIYIATKYQNQRQAALLRDRLLALALAAGVTVECTARWIDGQSPPDDPVLKINYDETWGKTCLDDVLASDAVLVLTRDHDKGPVTGGMHVETGLAIAKDKHVFLLGPEVNVFHWLPRIQKFTDEDHCLAALLRHAEFYGRKAA